MESLFFSLKNTLIRKGILRLNPSLLLYWGDKRVCGGVVLCGGRDKKCIQQTALALYVCCLSKKKAPTT